MSKFLALGVKGIIDAYEKTGITPTSGIFHVTRDGVECGCPLYVVGFAKIPNFLDARGDKGYVGQIAEEFDENYNDMTWFYTGFDGSTLDGCNNKYYEFGALVRNALLEKYGEL